MGWAHFGRGLQLGALRAEDPGFESRGQAEENLLEPVVSLCLLAPGICKGLVPPPQIQRGQDSALQRSGSAKPTGDSTSFSRRPLGHNWKALGFVNWSSGHIWKGV